MSDVAATEPGFVSVGTVSTVIRAKNIGRRKIILVNDHATAVVYVQLATANGVQPTAVVGSGIRLNAAGGSYTEDGFDGGISAISTAAATNVCVTEF